MLTPPRGELERPLREHVGRHAGTDECEDAQSDATKLFVNDEVDREAEDWVTCSQSEQFGMSTPKLRLRISRISKVSFYTFAICIGHSS